MRSPALRSVVASLPLWLVLITCETTLQMLLKTAGDRIGAPTLSVHWVVTVLQTPLVLAAGACYVGTFCSWMLILKRTPLSFAFPATAVTYVSVLIGSYWLFDERIVPWRYLGIALIVIGISLLRDSD